MTKHVRLRALLGAGLVAASVPAAGSDWRQHLGPSGLGTSPEKGIFAKGLSPRIAWKAALTSAASGLAVADGRVYTLARDEERDYAVALDLKDGRELWRVTLDALPPNAAGLGAAATPAAAAGRVITISAHCQLRAHDGATGAVAWHRDLKADFAVPAPRVCTGSPLVDGERVLTTVPGKDDAGFAAFELASGKTAWVAEGALRTHYAESSLATLGGERVVLVNHAVLPPPPATGQRPAPPRGGLTVMRVSDGARLAQDTLDEGFSWEAPLLLAPDRVALFTNNEIRLFALKQEAGKWSMTPAMRTGDLAAGLGAPFVHDGVLYGVKDDDFAAVDFATGATLWKHKMYFGAAFFVDGHVALLPASSGVLHVGEATRAGWKEKAKLEVLNRGPRANASPVFAGGLLLVKNDEEVAAVRLN